MAHDHEHPHINLDDHHNCPPHFHADERGFLVKCYHHCKSFVKMPSFWAAQTLLFPLEHFLWTKVPGFSHLAEMLGLITH
jgi:hypothetical protein